MLRDGVFFVGCDKRAEPRLRCAGAEILDKS
jgi:hypothetical protein